MTEKTSSENFNPSLLKQLQKILHESVPPSSYEPWTEIVDVHQEIYKKKGEELLKEGKVGTILLAGGQGTRLGFSGPKGCLPITPEKTLFQYFADQVKDHLKMAIMTSKDNHEATLTHFRQLGLKSDQISFFQQGELPFLTLEGQPLLTASGKVAFGPDGNGAAVRDFFKSPIASQWEKEGIVYVTLILIDNPLADPFDPYLIGAHALSGAEITLKCIMRNPEEKLGLVVKRNGKPHVIEYSEAPEELWKNHFLSNISLFCFSMSFLKKVANEPLPLHKALKNGVWKFEHFIFDLLDYSDATQVALYSREETFAPIKEASDIEKAQRAIKKGLT